MNYSNIITSNRRIAPAVLTMICLFLGLYRLDYQSIWLDEFTTLQVSQTLESIMGYCRAFPEQHPLYYLIVLSTGAYKSIFTVRLLSLLFGAATVFPLYLIATKLFSERVALLSTLFFSVSPFILYYNQEGRMYTLLMFLAAMQVNFFISWFINKGKSGQAGFIVLSILCLYTHFFALFLIFSEAVFLLLTIKAADSPIGIRRAVLVFLSLALSYIPWALFMALNLGQNTQTWKGIRHIVLGAPYTFFRFIYGYAVFPINYDIKMNFASHIWQMSTWAAVLVMAFIPAVIILNKNSVFSGKARLVPLLAFLPLILMTVASLFKNMIGERYLVFSVPFLYLMIAAIAVNGYSSRKYMAVLAFILPFSLSLFGVVKYFTNEDFGKINNKAAARYIIDKSPRNILVLCNPAYVVQGALDYYLNGSRNMLPYYRWNGSGREPEVWVLEDIFNTIDPGNLSPFGYRKVGETVWPQENGLRLTIWKKV